MEDDRLERLLRAYRLPETSRRLDERVLAEGTAIVAGTRERIAWADLGHALLHRLGFGHVAWAIDLVTTTDAEYSVVVL
jgi:hypothetical protein